ncbi:MAG: glycosyltransferase [Ignavibacteriaceae bacterium]|nr:glycosyltransferase [Ignavibacteriaceae bacterium]
MKKVLFISYYWPPSGKASIHFPLKIIKHLPSFDWLPVVLTVTEDTFSQKDETFINEVPKEVKIYRAKTYEPFNFYKKFTGKEKDQQLVASETISTKNKSIAHRLSVWIRMNLFIPDARVGWYFPAVNQGLELLKKERVEAIVSIGPPHTTHLIGKKLSAKHKLPHIPVFIDPWVDISYYLNYKRNKLALAIDNHLEKSVLKNSSAVIFVTETMKNDYEKKYSFVKNKSKVLYWGYSEEEFEEIEIENKLIEEKTIVHAGNIFSYQNPISFWEQLKKEIDSGNKIKLKFIGTVDPTIKESISEASLDDVTEYMGFLPYKKMLDEVCSSDFLLVCATEPRHVPGKLFEYLRAGKPIIAFGNRNDEVKEIIKNANAGMMFGYEESGEEFFRKYSSFKTNKEFVKGFDRRSISEEFRNILNRL